MDSTTKCSQ